jgi:general secretion pathway protein L
VTARPTYVLWLNVDDVGASPWWPLDSATAQGLLRTGLADAAVIVLVPGPDIAVHWLDEDKAVSTAQASAYARLRLKNQLAAPLDTLHLAAGMPGPGESRTPVAVVDRTTLRGWLDALAEFGVDPVHIVPAAMALPATDGLIARSMGTRLMLRGPHLCADLEADLAAAVQPLPPHSQDWQALDAAQLTPPLLDLRQGDYASKAPRIYDLAGLGHVLKVAAIAAALVISATAVDGWRHSRAADALIRDQEQLARAALPTARRIVNAPAQLREAASQVTPDAGVVSGRLVPLLAAFGGQATTRLDAANFADARLQVSVVAPESEATDLAARAQAAGLIVEPLRSTPIPEGLQLDWQVDRR